MSPIPIAVVLPGGADPSAVQVGMLRALVERRVRPDLIVDTSVGAVDDASIADQWSVESSLGLGEIWTGLRRSQISRRPGDHDRAS